MRDPPLETLPATDDDGIRSLGRIFGLLGHPDRLRIVLHLVEDGELTVSDLSRGLHIPQSSVSRHLAKLRAQDLVQKRCVGKNAPYSFSGSQELREAFRLLRRFARTRT